MHTIPQTAALSDARHTAQALAESAAHTAQEALSTLGDKVDDARQAAPGMLSRAAAQVDDLTRRSLQRAQDARDQVKDQMTRAGDASRGYIRDEPVKSVLIAAATGAAVAALVSFLVRDRSPKA